MQCRKRGIIQLNKPTHGLNLVFEVSQTLAQIGIFSLRLVEFFFNNRQFILHYVAETIATASSHATTTVTCIVFYSRQFQATA